MATTIIDVQDVWSAIDHAYETMAELQYEIADRSRVSGDVTALNQKMTVSIELSAYVGALEELSLNITAVENRIVHRLYSNIKVLTKDLRRWD